MNIFINIGSIYTMEFVVSLASVSSGSAEKAGVTAVVLSDLSGAGVPIPDGFVVTNAGFNEFLKENGAIESVSGLLENIGGCGPEELAEKSKKVRDVILSGKIPNKLNLELKAAYSSMSVSKGMENIDADKLGSINAGGSEALVAVRSSVFTSGSKKILFKGFYPSYLYVGGFQGVKDKLKECWASLYSDEAIFARQKYNGGQDIFVGVIIQKMIDGEKSGVCTTANPLTNNADEIVIESSFGSGLACGGEITPDVFIVEKSSTILKGKKINSKEWKLVKHAVSGDVIKEKISPELTNSQSLNGNEIALISNMAKNVETVMKMPIYMEWVCKRDKLYVVNVSRILTMDRPIKPVSDSSGDLLFRGIGACSGGAEGVARKVHDVSDIAKIKAGDILVAPSLEPASILVLNRVGGVIVESGGVLSDMSILCRELDVPIVVNCSDACEMIEEGSRIFADATSGKIYLKGAPLQNDLNQSSQDLGEVPVPELKTGMESGGASAILPEGDGVGERVPAEVGQQETKVSSISAGSNEEEHPFTDADAHDEGKAPDLNDVKNMIEEDPQKMITGTKVKVLASSLQKPETLFDGIGLLPSELVLLNLGKHPDKVLSEGMENELIKYIETKFGPLVESVYPKPLAFRTLSAQTSTLRKLPDGDHEQGEVNPKLGWRGIRRSLDSPALFKAELKALNNLVLKGYDNIEILLPFVHHPGQVSEVKQIFSECGIDAAKMHVGISIESPAAGLIAVDFARAGVDFVFVDCDRIAEHMLGVDTANPRVRKHFDAKHPGVLKMIKMIIKDYKDSNIFVNVGGSFLDNPDIVERLVEFGVDAIVVPADKMKVSKYIVARAERKMLLDVMREGRKF